MTETTAASISVCIPVRNGERELPHTLSNLLVHSNYPRERVEVLVGDHGSSDGTAAIVNRFQRRFPELVHVAVPYTSPNRASVRNALIGRARGDILVFIDHDVLVSKDFLRRHVDAHRKFPGALIAGQTFGKGILKQDIEALLGELHLDDISTSFEQLRAFADLADLRTRPGTLPAGGPDIDLSHELAPFRFFWTCNISARRSDIDECGQFDEAYDGWGMEDDDFAHQFRNRDKRLIFSHDAWAFHIPHPSNAWTNLVSWRRNFEYFFRKFATREIEYYSLYGSEISAGTRRLGWLLGMLQQVDSRPLVEQAATLVSVGRGRRLCHFLSDPELALRLGVTDALDPYLALNAREFVRSGVRFWPYLGVKTNFSEREIDESVLLVDKLMLLDRPLLTLLLVETARISKRVVFCSGANARDPARAFSLRTLHETASLICFPETVWLEAACPSS